MSTYGTGAPAPPRDANQSIGDLVGALSADTSKLFRQEVALAKAEMRQEATAAGTAIGELMAAAVIAQVALIMASIGIAVALDRVMDLDWAYAVVALVWFLIAAVLGLAGRAKLRRLNPAPERTVETLREIPDTVKGL